MIKEDVGQLNKETSF